jgi:hypothetical protein
MESNRFAFVLIDWSEGFEIDRMNEHLIIYILGRIFSQHISRIQSKSITFMAMIPKAYIMNFKERTGKITDKCNPIHYLPFSSDFVDKFLNSSIILDIPHKSQNTFIDSSIVTFGSHSYS